MIVREHDILSLDQAVPGGRRTRSLRTWSSMPYVLAAGSPRILQAAPPAEAIKSEPNQDHRYSYEGLEPRRFDTQGRIVEFSLWSVVCDGNRTSTSRPAGKGATAARGVRRRGRLDSAPDLPTVEVDKPVVPLAGLKMDPDGGGCTAESKTALANAARVSKPNATYAVSRWVRDGVR
jgi:hypothetical protein